jgi:hypothetical protein
MLRPTKHSHPDRTVINVALVLLARLKARRIDEYVVHSVAWRKCLEPFLDQIPGNVEICLAPLNLRKKTENQGQDSRRPTTFLLICLAPSLSAQDLQVIKDSDSAQYVGKNVEVRGLVDAVFTSDNIQLFVHDTALE